MLSIASPSWAQSGAGDRAVAESLFIEARQLMDENKIHEACAKFEASQKLDPALGTLLNLAVCHEREGRIATAWSEFREALTLAKREQREDREALAAERIKALEERLPKLTVEVPAESKIKGLSVRVNGTQLVEAVWGTPIPVNPGVSDLAAEAPGYLPWSSKVNVAEGKTETIKIPLLKEAPVEAPPPPSQPPQPPPAPLPPSKDSLHTTTSYVLLGVGALGVGVGGYFGLRAFSKKSDSDTNCPQNRCTQLGVNLNNEAKSSARIANLGIGLGLVALGAGAYLLFSGSSAPEPSTASLSFSIAPLPRGGAASLGGSF